MRAAIFAVLIVGFLGCARQPDKNEPSTPLTDDAGKAPPKPVPDDVKDTPKPLPGATDKDPIAKDPPRQLPADIVRAWNRAGALVGWAEVDKRGFLNVVAKAEAGAVPAFLLGPWKDGVVAKLPAPETPFGLDLHFTQVTDAGLKEIANLKNLTSLDLHFTQVTDAGLKELASLKNLHTLCLAGTKVTDAGLKELASLKNLTTLDLSATRMTAVGLKELADLKNLTSLNLSFARVTDVGLKELANLKNLTILSLGGTRVTDVGIKELANLKNLTTLNLIETQVTAVGLKEVADLKNLDALFLSSTKVTDAGLKELANLKNLTLLDLRNTKVSENGVAELKKVLPKCYITTPKLLPDEIVQAWKNAGALVAWTEVNKHGLLNDVAQAGAGAVSTFWLRDGCDLAAAPFTRPNGAAFRHRGREFAV